MQIKDIEKDLDRKAKDMFSIKKETILKPTIENMDNIAKSLANNKIIKNFLTNKNTHKREDLEILFLAIANSNNTIIQARLIDKNGQEVIRVDRNKESQEAFLVEKSSLQDKSQREYFKVLSNAPKNTIWHSKLDLNIENNKLEIPYKPTFRVAIPLFEEDKFTGIVTVNMLMNNLLKAISASSIFEYYIVDKNENYILHPNNEFSFNKYKNINRAIKDDFPQGLNTQGIYRYSLEDILKNNEQAVMILKTKRNYQKEILNEKFNTAIIVLALTVVLSLLMALFVSKIPMKLQEKLLKAYEKLDEFTSILNKYVITVKTKPDSTIIEVSDAFEKASGYSKDELIGKSISMIKHPEQDRKIIKDLWKNILNKRVWVGNIKNKKKSGEEYWLEQTIIPKLDEDKKNIDSFLSISVDITAKMELEKMASIDKLTDIYNRRMIDQFLQVEIEIASRHNEELSLMIIDIDHFKHVNDNYGHLVGDIVLSQLSKIISDNLRNSDIFGRYGGEEFLIICPKTNKDGAFILAEKLRIIVNDFTFDEVGHKTVSIGIAEFQTDDTIETLFKKADEALYEAKNSGRNRVCV
ncbi:diguanylate cyclase [Aliarcobacter butzleri]|uniref:sensor domain-containing diguanylate cyclase n=1 Tax=Aliarcobacter butzleri TaxID=28197 RepID=UPI00263EDF58|nr:diguanylate cyclase [Aliarcobacter butzleri]MDN5078556.1 diguanylate cyclase [Aliarcobacter butzleri]MDN5119839.1 diguanylate cyclase [Aliarcobacter butzleri]